MKVGVITWFQSDNYGTVLQAMALQRYLKENGFNPELVNFRVFGGDGKRKSSFKHKFSRLFYHLNGILFGKWNQIKNAKMENAISDNCHLSKRIRCDADFIDVCNSYDVIVCGSDQIWNPEWFHPYYYADFNEIITKKIAYAPSFGVRNISFKKDEIRTALFKFSDIAVREEDGRKIVEKLIGKEAKLVVDPTLLLTREDWSNFEDESAVPTQKYLLCYLLSDNFRHFRAARRFAHQRRLRLVIIPNEGLSFFQSGQIERGIGAGAFLSLIKNAEYIITDSFHGTIFSLIYQKDFWLFERHNPKWKTSQNSRLYNLVKMVGLQDRILGYDVDRIDEGDVVINYGLVKTRLSGRIEESKRYLKKALEVKDGKR